MKKNSYSKKKKTNQYTSEFLSKMLRSLYVAFAHKTGFKTYTTSHPFFFFFYYYSDAAIDFSLEAVDSLHINRTVGSQKLSLYVA